MSDCSISKYSSIVSLTHTPPDGCTLEAAAAAKKAQEEAEKKAAEGEICLISD